MASLLFKKIRVIRMLLTLSIPVISVSRVQAEPQVPCLFIFGDSLLDNGNNNAISSLANTNYQPYGIDFPDGPTGRFCNGRTAGDIIAQLLGFIDFIPPYATASGKDLLRGANYASGAAGIRIETGRQYGARISMNGQLQNHRSVISQVVNILGTSDAATNHLQNCIYMVGMGSNDYLNNYFMPLIYGTSWRYTPDQYANVLIEQYSQQLRTLYDYGARKVALIGIGPIGCTPFEITRSSINDLSCDERINSANQLFNDRLKNLVDELNNDLQDAKFSFVNAYGIFSDIFQNATSYGFRFSTTACCGLGRNNGIITCLPHQIPCANRSEYLYWDAFHPTEAANLIIARRTYNAQSPLDVYPIDIHSMALL
ncbi:GDSL esterase/lipase At5g45670-like [Macadamia integrifolia]|uniref:GDSL esterase/lipase At5g45670-like n=1 Tax=Macadamia integrifolia TaxID=60698 RepID=UPI001C4F20F9|nr:GDSL esterase/lipase At5g45670-like [Macadamia integrifolia]